MTCLSMKLQFEIWVFILLGLRNIGKDLRKTQVEYVTTNFSIICKDFEV